MTRISDLTDQDFIRVTAKGPSSIPVHNTANRKDLEQQVKNYLTQGGTITELPSCKMTEDPDGNWHRKFKI
jgi:hypothetical protein